MFLPVLTLIFCKLKVKQNNYLVKLKEKTNNNKLELQLAQCNRCILYHSDETLFERSYKMIILSDVLVIFFAVSRVFM